MLVAGERQSPIAGAHQVQGGIQPIQQRRVAGQQFLVSQGVEGRYASQRVERTQRTGHAGQQLVQSRWRSDAATQCGFDFRQARPERGEQAANFLAILGIAGLLCLAQASGQVHAFFPGTGTERGDFLP